MQVIDRENLDELIKTTRERSVQFSHERVLKVNCKCFISNDLLTYRIFYYKYCLQAIASSIKPFAQGRMIERIILSQLFSSRESRGLIYSYNIEKSCPEVRFIFQK